MTFFLEIFGVMIYFSIGGYSTFFEQNFFRTIFLTSSFFLKVNAGVKTILGFGLILRFLIKGFLDPI